jgi:hypothetical protein
MVSKGGWFSVLPPLSRLIRKSPVEEDEPVLRSKRPKNAEPREKE